MPEGEEMSRIQFEARIFLEDDCIAHADVWVSELWNEFGGACSQTEWVQENLKDQPRSVFPPGEFQILIKGELFGAYDRGEYSDRLQFDIIAQMPWSAE